MMNLQSQLETVLTDARGSFGFAVEHVQTGEKATIRGGELFQMASVFKIPLLAALLQEVKVNKVSLEERITIKETDYVPGSGLLAQLSPNMQVTVKDLATLMIIVSDNMATDWLLNHVGINKVATYMRELGLAHIHVNQSCWQLICLALGKDYPNYTEAAAKDLRTSKYTPDSYDLMNPVFHPDERGNTSTPEAMNKLLLLLAKKQLLTDSLCDTMVDILVKQQFNSRLPYLLPVGTKVAHKTGTIHNVINDAGIVYLPENKGSFAITVFSSENSSMAEGEGTIARLAKAAYDYFLYNTDEKSD